MKIFILIISIFSSLLFDAQEVSFAPSKPVTESYFGHKIVDEYRNLENIEDLLTSKWMKSQTLYTNSLLNQIPKKDYYLQKRLELDERQGYAVSNLKITDNDKYFYLKKNANEKVAKLYYREALSGKEELIYDPSGFVSTYKNENSKHQYIINFISPSWDGSKVAVSLSEQGKETSEIIIVKVKTKEIFKEIVTSTDPATIGGIKWLDDNSGFFYVYFPVIDPKSSDFNKNTQTLLYKIGQNPSEKTDVFSLKNNPSLKITEDQYPIILTYHQNENYYVGILADMDKYRNTFIIKKESLLQGKKNWKPFYDKSDKVYSMKLVGDEVIFLSGYNSPNLKLCKTSIKSLNFKNPTVLVPEQKDEVFADYTVTSDGIYYSTSKNGVEAKLYVYKNGKSVPVKLPYTSGSVDLQSKGVNYPDLWITCSGWANDEQRFKYDLKTNTFKNENLASVIEYPEFKDIIVEEVVVRARDGEEIPLSLIYNKNITKNGKNPVMIDGYGSYGVSRTPFFAKSYLLWASEGGIMAIAHVRGGGEKGEKWRLGGFKETKPNSWKDLIDCTEFLIKEGYTSKNKIAVWGTSAGGITVGRAITERPDLFKAAIVEVGMTNALRDETTVNSNAKEFGTVKNPDEFNALLEMDAYSHIKKGEKYPSTLVTGGINDERVAVWQPVKFAAKLIANNASDNPILLKIDYEGGHGGNVPIAQRYANLGDIFNFAFWQLGHPDYQPKNTVKK